MNNEIGLTKYNTVTNTAVDKTFYGQNKMITGYDESMSETGNVDSYSDQSELITDYDAPMSNTGNVDLYSDQNEINNNVMSKAVNISTNTNSEFSKPSLENEEIVEVISTKCWYASGAVENLKTEFLVDTGSTFTIADIDLYNTIPEQDRPKLEHIDLKLRSANGGYMTVFG